MILGEAVLGAAYGAQHPGVEIGDASDEVEHVLLHGVVEKRVDGEITAPCVFLGVGEMDVVRVPPIGVGALAAEGGDLEFLPIEENKHHAKGSAHADGALEQSLDLLGPGRSGDIPVFGGGAKQLIADAAANHVGLVTMGAEGADDVQGSGVAGELAGDSQHAVPYARPGGNSTGAGKSLDGRRRGQ